MIGPLLARAYELIELPEEWVQQAFSPSTLKGVPVTDTVQLRGAFHVKGHDKRGAIMLRQNWSREHVPIRSRSVAFHHGRRLPRTCANLECNRPHDETGEKR